MAYKHDIKTAMQMFAADERSVFLGYNVGAGSKGGGSFAGIEDKKLIEMPLAENLMMGAAIGMSLEGYYPLVYFERFDFVLNAIDAIVNHLDKFDKLSRGEFKPCAVLRVVLGNRHKPLFTGLTHTQDFTDAMKKLVAFPVISLERRIDIISSYNDAYNRLRVEHTSTMLVEHKDRYEE